jgi:hypothetical protein
VHPENVRQLQIGTVLNARRGEGNLRECVVGGLMITNRPAIDLSRRGTHRSLSAGYNASYEQREPGCATQNRIREEAFGGQSHARRPWCGPGAPGSV